MDLPHELQDTKSIAAHPSTSSKKFTCSTKMTVEVVHDLSMLDRHVAAWENLASAAVEPNVFYEPWVLIPAVRAFVPNADLVFVFIYANDNQGQSPTLCGFFPLERTRRLKRLLPSFRLLKHFHCYLSTPLIRKSVAAKTIRTFFEWLNQSHHRRPLMELPEISGDGPFLQELVSEFWPTYCYQSSFTRALIRKGENADEYLMNALSGDQRRELGRRKRRLSELGDVRIVRIDRLGDHEWAIDSFLKLEASGWKGEQGVAMACEENNRTYFSELVTAGLARRQLILTCLMLDEKPIAMTCDLISPPGCFAFKIAFDKEYASFAPGVQLMLDHIHSIHSRPDIDWMDSCTSASSVWVKSLWSDRKTVTSILVPTGTIGGELAVTLLPLYSWLSGKLRSIKHSTTSAHASST